MLEQLQQQNLCVKAFPTTTRSFDVRIAEDKFGCKPALNVVHFGAQDRELSFHINPNFHTIL